MSRFLLNFQIICVTIYKTDERILFFMYINGEKLGKTLGELEQTLLDYKLPEWENLPYIELYMDQVISILGNYLEIYYETIGTQKFVTPSMINNYVKLGIIPPPVKKRYSRVHLAYLIIICTLKQTLDMATIQKIIPIGLDEAETGMLYNSFVKNQRKAFAYVTENVKMVADPIMKNESESQERLNDLLMQVSVSANIFKILTEKITQMPPDEDV